MIALLLIKTTSLLACAAILDVTALRRASAATRHLVWTLTMIALLALPIASVALPVWQVAIPVERATAIAAVRAIDALPATTAGVTAFTPAARSNGDGVNSRTPAVPILTAIAALYLSGVMLLLARFAAEPFVLRRLTSRALEMKDDGWHALLERCARAAGVTRRVRLLQAPSEVMPLTFGTIAPVIVLPASATTWSDERRSAVLLHELAHVARFDCLVQRLTAIAGALYWPHPGVWWAARRLRTERELACDDRVLAAGAGARDYASHLLDIAHTFRSAPAPATALGMARPKQLERRLLAILDAARNRTTLGRAGIVAATVIAGAVLTSTAVVRAALVAPGAVAAEPARPAPASLVEQDPAGTWELKRLQDPGMVQILIRVDRSTHGRHVPIASLAGLPVEQIDAPNATVHFPLRRDAGTFTVDGVCRKGLCAGTFSFAADPAFADALVKRGIGRPSPADQLSLAIADAGFAYLDALAAAGYARPDVQTLVRAAQHGVELDYLRGMTALGYRTATLHDLIRLRDHGVDPDYIRGMQAAGYARLSADELRNARDHGADPVYAREMGALGFANLPLDALINARDHGVDQTYVREMQALGLRLTLDDYIRTRDHGVDPGYVHGLSDLGYKGLTADTLVRMRDHGVDPEWVRRIQRNGGNNLSVDELIYRRDRGIDR